MARFQKPIGVSIIRVARRWGALPQECLDDLIQETYLKLCADKCSHLYEFALKHPEKVDAYVKTIAVNVANDFFKASRSIKRGGGEIVQLLDCVEPKAHHTGIGSADAIQRDLVLHEIDRCLQTCITGRYKDRDRRIFWLYYRDGMSANAIACLPALQLQVKGVESVLRRLERLVREHMIKVQNAQEAMPESSPKGLGSANSYL